MTRLGHKDPLRDNASPDPELEIWQERVFDMVIEPRVTVPEHLGRLTVRPELDGEHPRNRFVKQYGWIPESKREVTIMTEGLLPGAGGDKLSAVLYQAGNARQNRGQSRRNQLKPVARTYNQFRGWWKGSLAAASLLNLALPEGHTDRNEPSTVLIWTTHGIRKTMVDFILNRTKLDAYVWQVPTLEQSAKEQWEATLHGAGRDELAGVWRIARDSHEERAKDLGEQLTAVRNDGLVIETASDPTSEIRLL
jgi:hypothetical protein